MIDPARDGGALFEEPVVLPELGEASKPGTKVQNNKNPLKYADFKRQGSQNCGEENIIGTVKWIWNNIGGISSLQ